MAANIRTFELELKAMFDTDMGKVRHELIELALDADRLLREGSPVDTGQFRANWLLSVGSPSSVSQEGAGGALVTASISAMTSYPTDAFPVIYAQNNLPYANRLEEGYSAKAPLGVVAITVPSLQAIWDGKKI
jgi:hypothetical protein